MTPAPPVDRNRDEMPIFGTLKWKPRRAVRCALIGLAAAGSIACAPPNTTPNRALKVAGPRSIALEDGTTVRLASILPPTTYDVVGDIREWDWEDRARTAVSKLTAGANILLKPERKGRDRYGRRVAQVWLSMHKSRRGVDRRWVQGELVRTGFARVSITAETDPDCAKQLLILESNAQREKLGLWQDATYQVRTAAAPRAIMRFRSTFQIVAGRIRKVDFRRGWIYLNFGSNWKTDFTARLQRRLVRTNRIRRSIIQALENKWVRIRGWIERRNGPLVSVWRLEQIELLKESPSGTPQRHQPVLLLSDAQRSPDTRKKVQTK